LNAKKSFLKMGTAKAFADVIHSPAVQTAMDYALLEMQERLHVSDEVKFALIYAELHGARLFREILENLSIPDEDFKVPRTPTLNHDAYDKPTRSR
jgi:hypothetical protein